MYFLNAKKRYSLKKDLNLTVKCVTFNHYYIGSNPVGLKKKIFFLLAIYIIMKL